MTDADPATDPGSVQLVPMTEAHLDLVMPHELQMFGTEAWSRAGYLEELSDRQHRRYLAAEDADGALLGWAGVQVVADTAQILTIGTVPQARRRGVGRLLVDALLMIARDERVVDVFLEVREDNAEARRLYERVGFAPTRIRRGYYDGGRVDAQEMHLRLC